MAANTAATAIDIALNYHNLKGIVLEYGLWSCRSMDGKVKTNLTSGCGWDEGVDSNEERMPRMGVALNDKRG